jgi:hypothetical protein
VAVAIFDKAAFLALYPEFTAYDAANPNSLAAKFAQAGLYLDNTDCSPVQDINHRTQLLYMVTAHLLAGGGAFSANGQPGPAGRISSATEGTVSVSLQSFVSETAGTAGWWNSTGYGAQFWAATANLRSARYIPNPTNPYTQNSNVQSASAVYGYYPGYPGWRG